MYDPRTVYVCPTVGLSSDKNYNCESVRTLQCTTVGLSSEIESESPCSEETVSVQQGRLVVFL